MKETRRALRLFLLNIIKGLAVAHDGGSGKIDARKGVETSGARLFRARAENDVAVEHDMHARRAVVRAVKEGVREVAAGVGIARVDGFLRPRQHDGLRAVLDEIGQRGGGVRHRIRSVRDDEAVELRVTFFDDARDGEPMSAADVGAVEIERLDGGHGAGARDLGYAVEQFFGGEFGFQPVSPVAGGDRSSGCDHEYFFHR